jgi:hypothetical protein
MTDDPSMPAERFAALADAYGGDLRRWPAGDRSVAEAMLASGHPAFAAIVDRAGRLDTWLEDYRVAAPSSDLAALIMSAATRPRIIWRRARLWWSGLGLAGVGLAGALAGSLAISVALPAIGDRHPTILADEQMTAFDDAGPAGSDL